MKAILGIATYPAKRGDSLQKEGSVQGIPVVQKASHV